MATVSLLLGGNIGNTAALFDRAFALLEERVGGVVCASARHTTPAWGFECESDFLNQALDIECHLSPLELLDITQSIEQELGRSYQAERDEKELSGERYCSRPIDIDILLWEDKIVEHERLNIPHKELALRSFALKPLAEICPERVHPKLRLTIAEMAQNRTI
ncbi:MAG: 2-amino-4-hydroxy-6-hydroxymethyldihydropteridine diphosphokinase [Rikenellaceae bacterium]